MDCWLGLEWMIDGFETAMGQYTLFGRRGRGTAKRVGKVHTVGLFKRERLGGSERIRHLYKEEYESSIY